jgi:hypothetical protein
MKIGHVFLLECRAIIPLGTKDWGLGFGVRDSGLGILLNGSGVAVPESITASSKTKTRIPPATIP